MNTRLRSKSIRPDDPATPASRPFLLSFAILAGVALLAGVACVHGLRGNPPRMSNSRETEDLKGAASLRAELRMSTGKLNVDRALKGRLYDIGMHWDQANLSRSLNLARTGAESVLKAEIRGERSSAGDENSMDASLTGDIPLQLSVETGVGENQLNLTDMQITSLRLRNGVGECLLRVEEPQEADCTELNVETGVGEMKLTGLANLAPRQIRFKGGIGETTLDFSGTGTRDIVCRAEGGIGQLEVRLPRGLGVRIRARGGLSGISIPGDQFIGRGDEEYESRGYATARQKLDLDVHQGIGNIAVNLID